MRVGSIWPLALRSLTFHVKIECVWGISTCNSQQLHCSLIYRLVMSNKYHNTHNSVNCGGGEKQMNCYTCCGGGAIFVGNSAPIKAGDGADYW